MSRPGLLLLGLLLCGTWLAAGEGEPLRPEAARSQAALRGLAWLRQRQRPDGRFGQRYPTALTGFALLAHLAAGTGPEDPAWPALRRAHEALLAVQEPDGQLGAADGSGMYGHAIATLALAELAGLAGDDELEERTVRALASATRLAISAAQVPRPPAHAGGWRYEPDSTTSDLSVTGWQMLALAAAQEAGIGVPDAVLVGGLGYLRQRLGEDGRVGYDARNPADRPGLRGLALLALASRGVIAEPDRHLVPRIAARITASPPAWQGEWFFYRALLDAAGLCRTAPEGSSAWSAASEALLVANQAVDGSWPLPPGGTEEDLGGEYRTALAVLALCVRQQALGCFRPVR